MAILPKKGPSYLESDYDMGELHSDSDVESLSSWDMEPDDALVQKQLDRLWIAEVEMRKRSSHLTHMERQHLIRRMDNPPETLVHMLKFGRCDHMSITSGRAE